MTQVVAARLTDTSAKSVQQSHYLRTLGADYIFDYRDEAVVRKIKAAVPEGKHLRHAFDCVGIDISPLEEAVEPQGTIVLALPPTRPSPQHHAEMVMAGVIHDLEDYKAEGFKFHEGKEPRDTSAGKTLRLLMEWTLNQAGKKYQPGKVKRLSGKGMYDAFEAFELMRVNGISAEKVVWRISETPGLYVDNT